MSQPTVGRHVAELDSQLGVVLFERTASVPVAVILMPPVLAQLRLALPEILVELVSSNQM